MEKKYINIKSFRFIGLPKAAGSSFKPEIKVKSQTYGGSIKEKPKIKDYICDLVLQSPYLVQGDFKLEFFHKGVLGSKKLFHLWLNTDFIDENFTKI